jgi:Fe-S cluster assembly protein SufD
MEDVLKKTKFNTLREHFTPTLLPFSSKAIMDAEELLGDADFPNRKNEKWKYTNVNGLSKLSFDGFNSDFFGKNEISNSSEKLIISNGKLADNHPTISGVKTIWEKLPDTTPQDPFDALNILYCTQAIEITIGKEENRKDIEVVFENTKNTYVFPRIYIRCQKGAKGTVILNYQGAKDNASFTNVSTFIEVEENAHLSVHKIQKNGEGAFDLQRDYVNQAANSSFTINTFSVSGKMTRNDLWINVNGNNCETFMNGAYTLKDKSHCDNHTTVDHKVAHCYSKELYKGVVDDRATSVFNGKVFVRKDAQKINAFQSNANILLSETGTVNSKPELEIYADDVKCSHGSTTGQLDDEAIFYLRSRGLSEKGAKELLVKAFLGEVLEEVEHEDVRSYVEEQIENHFQ